MHVRDRRAFRWMDTIRSRMEECKILALELNLEEAASGVNALAKGAHVQDLRKALSAKEYSKLQHMLKKAFGVDLDTYEAVSPLLIVQAIDESILHSEMPLSLDEALFIAGKELGLHLAGLETLAEQMDVLRAIPWKYQLDMLKRIARKPDRYRRAVLRISARYFEGDLDALHRGAVRRAGGFRRLLVWERNERMAGRLAELALATPVFAAVGAGHLSGQHGMLRRIRLQGFNIQHVDLTDTSLPGAV